MKRDEIARIVNRHLRPTTHNQTSPDTLDRLTDHLAEAMETTAEYAQRRQREVDEAPVGQVRQHVADGALALKVAPDRWVFVSADGFMMETPKVDRYDPLYHWKVLK